jgi:hypothetical protein
MAMNPHRTVFRTSLAGLLLAAAGSASAADAWVAMLDVDDGVEAYTVRIVAATEDDCIARASMYRGAEVISPCQPTASAITDPNDANPSTRPSRQKRPSPVSGSGSGGAGSGGNTGNTGSGSSGGGAGGGSGGGW